MKLRSLIGALLLVAVCQASLLRADEPTLEFLAGLRAREYYDTALEYLDYLEKKGDLSPEVKQAIPYERAVTLSADAREQRNPENQSKQLETARTLLQQFIQSSPRHVKAAEANSDLGQLYMTRGRLLAQQARSLPGQAERATLQVQARGEFEKARSPFETAQKLFKTRLDAFPKQIDKLTQKDIYAAREQAMSDYIKSQFDLGHCTFEEAHAYDASSNEAKALLTRAAGEFEKIYQEFRTNGAGIYALLFQGQCFLEQGERNKALGIFDQILKLQEETGRLRPLQDQARHFRLVCLNDDKHPDHKGVKAEAEEWLKTASPGSKRTPAGLGIQWQLVQALDKLAKDKETTAVEKDLYLKQALATAQYVHQHQSDYKGPAGLIIGRLSAALKIKKTGTPRDFEAAFDAAMLMVDEMDARNKKIETGTPDERATQEQALELHRRDTARALRLALTLYTPKDSLADLNKARFLLAYVYFQLKDHSYDAALLAEHIAMRYKNIDEKVALDAAALAMAAYFQGYASAPEDQQKADIDRLLAMGEYIVKEWPGNDRSNEALMMLGRLYSQINQPAKAAEYYNRVPDKASAYLDAQLAAGLAYWQAYASQAVLPEKERPPKPELEAMMKKAEQILAAAVTKAEAKLAKGQPNSDSINAAKLSLVQILNGSGDYQKALDLLTSGDRSLTIEVAASDPKARPERGSKSRLFASLTYREALRAYVGKQDVENARASLKQLETLEEGGAQGLNALLRDLGQQLQSEVQRLQQSNDPRVSEVTASFEKFLGDLLQRKDGQDYTMLLWIGETYAALGDGLKGGGGNQAKAIELFTKAAEAYKAILALAAAKPGTVPANALLPIRMRLVSALRRQQAFQPALDEIHKILKEQEKQFDGQIEAARLYTDWGLHSGDKDVTKWQISVKGDSKNHVWGWESISNQLLAATKRKPDPQYKKSFLDAKYHVALGYYRYGMQQPKTEDKLKFASRGRLEIQAAAAFLQPLEKEKNDPDWKRYDELSREIQTQINTLAGTKTEVVGLAVALNGNKSKAGAEPDEEKKEDETGPGAGAAKGTDKGEKQTAKAPDAGKADKKAAAKPKEESSSNLWVILGSVFALGACGFAGFMVWKSVQKTRRPTRRRVASRDRDKEKDADEADEPVATKKPATRKRRPLSASPPEETE